MKIKKETGKVLNNERGMVLVVSVLMLAVLTGLGTTAFMQTSTDLKISGNYKMSVQTFYASEAGIEEAKERLRGSSASHIEDPSNPTWSVYILTGSLQPSGDPDYDSSYTNDTTNSLQTDISYLVKIRRQTDASGNILYWGDSDGDGNNERNTTTGQKIYLVTSYGYSGTSTKKIEAEVITQTITVNSALYVKSNVSVNGVTASVDGTDNCGTSPALPPVYTKTPFATDPLTNPEGKEIFLPEDPVQGTDDFDIGGYVNSLKVSTTETITADQTAGTSYGSDTNFVTCYSDTSTPPNVQGLKLSKVTGYGILLVKGDLTLAANFSWNGLIFVTGTLTFNGGGTGIRIRGAVLSNQIVTLNGNIDIQYDSCMISNSMDNQPLVTINWKESY